MEVAALEERLQVAQSARFPQYRQVMWHAAAYYLASLSQGMAWPPFRLATWGTVSPVLIHQS